MARRLLGRKRGMTNMFDDKGNLIPCTVIECEKNVIIQKKTKEIDGYVAIQTGYELVKAKNPERQIARTKKPQRGHFAKANVEPRKHLIESKFDGIESCNVGEEFGVEIFGDIEFVDVMGVSKGKGFQGVMKLFNFAGGPASHGSKFHRGRGSQGMRTTPGRCFPGGKRPSQMGNRRVTVQGLKIVLVNPEENLIVVRGAIPGATDSVVCISPAIKKQKAK